VVVSPLSTLFSKKDFHMTTELPKTYDPREVEEKLYQWWESSGFFRAEVDPTKEPFVIAMPPPNVTGELHMGHAMFVTLEDMMTRYNRQRGKASLWIPGTDHAAIATHLQVERKLMKDQGKTRWEIGREAFEKLCWEWMDHYRAYITKQLRRLGASCDWSREAFTMDEGLSEAVVVAFNRLHDKGLIYRGEYMVNWAPTLQTTVSDLEVEYSEEKGTMYFFKYMLKDSDEFLPVATTRPETIVGDTAVAVHPDDERYQQYIGKTVIVPILGREIPVIADPYVERDFGTGALKITPGHDPNDYQIGKKHGLPTINILNKDATINANGGKYEGMQREATRAAIWADMQAADLVIKTQPHTLNVPRSQRGGEVVEPMVSTQWFVKMESLAKAGLDAVHDGRIRIIPDRFTKVYDHWLENIRDWAISRQLWLGHRIPAWYVNGDENTYIVAHTEAEAYEKARAQYGADVQLAQETDVLDTWFSSGLWPFSTLGWPEETPDYKYFYPNAVMETGYDILFFWVARMIMMGLEFTGEIPFHTVYLHGLVRAEDGTKMSKTKGNVIDPLIAANEYGTDALRFTLATGGTPGQDMNLSMERVESNRNFCNKLWNISRFILGQIGEGERYDVRRLDTARWERLPLAERWIISRLHEVTTEVTRHFDDYNFGEAGRTLYAFIWTEFADWYVEAAKSKLAGAEDTKWVLLYTLDKTLRLLHPTMPFITETIWQSLPIEKETDALMIAPWAEVGAIDEKAIREWELFQELVRGIRNARQEYAVEPGKRIPATIVAGDYATAFNAIRPILTMLARLDDAELTLAAAIADKPAPAASIVVGDGVEAYLPLAGLIDLGKELERLNKQIADTRAEVERIQGRLGNEAFVSKAPPAIIEGAREQLRNAEERLKTLEERKAALG
jgi:valyl-tRNA synthetase